MTGTNGWGPSGEWPAEAPVVVLWTVVLDTVGCQKRSPERGVFRGVDAGPQETAGHPRNGARKFGEARALDGS